MTIEQLRYFLAAAESLNFSEAARKLYVTQPTLSYGISSLEDQLQLKLFERGGRSLALTPAGKVFLENIRDVIRDVEIAIDKAKKIEHNFLPSLAIGFLGSPIKIYFPVWIPAFFKQHPEIDLNLMQMEMGNLHSALEDGTIDLACTRSVDLIDSKWAVWQKICDDPMCLVVRSDHHLASCTKVDLRTLRDEHFIIVDEKASPSWHKYIMQLCKNRGLDPIVVNSPVHMETVYTLVDAGMGITLMAKSAKNYNIKSLVFIELEGDDAMSDVVVAWQKNASNPAILAFLDVIKDLY